MTLLPRLRKTLATLLCLTGLLAAAQENSPSQQLAIGQRAPAFALKDQDGREVSLGGLLQKGPVAVVFIRSVEWCVYCQLQTMQLQQNHQEIEAGGGQIVIITYDAPEKIKRFADRHKISVPILSDPGSKTIEAYGMKSIRGSGDQVGASQHGTFVVDQTGIIRSKPYLTSFEERAAIDLLVQTLKQAKTAERATKL